MILAVVAACEVAFWLFLTLGLTARYLLRRRRLSTALLVAAPAVDLVLIGATVVSLRQGAPVSTGHALAPVYIGFSAAYGHRLIGWFDAQFAHRFADGPQPLTPTGDAYTALCWGDVGRTALAAVITAALTWGLIHLAREGADVSSLRANYHWVRWIMAIDVIWALSYTFWPRGPRSGDSLPTAASPATAPSHD